MAVTYIPGSNDPPVFKDPKIELKFTTAVQALPDKGNLVYEYNPLRNFRIKYDLYKSDDLGRLIYTTSNNPTHDDYLPLIWENEIITINNIYSMIRENVFYEKTKDYTNPAPIFDNNINSDDITLQLNNYFNTYFGTNLINYLNVEVRSGSLIDLETNLLGFNLNHPVQIECQESYDGSINLILNDDYNVPRLINSRFIKLELNTYKVANRSDNNDTNIYDDYSFDVDSSLYKRITSIPDLTFIGLLSGGNVPNGNYTFYFKYSDADGNETDFVAESGQVVCYIGNINDPKSARGGLSNENSHKMIEFQLDNIDTSYDYVTVYYTRKYSDDIGTPLIEVKKIDKVYRVDNQISNIIFTGYEPSIDLTIDDINIQYNIVDAAKTQAQSQNMLFMGNVHKPEIPYKELTDLSLRIYPVPFLGESIGNVNYNYTDNTGGFEYYNAKNIYEKLSYWDKEIYRFGIYYILNDYTLSPVFNIRGKNNVGLYNGNPDNFPYTEFPVYENTTNWVTGEKNRFYIDLTHDGNEIVGSTDELENAKGVVRFNIDEADDYIISNERTRPLGVRFYIPDDVITELSKYIKGYVIVRQKRIPTILCQAITIGLDRNSYLPLLPDIKGEFITERFVNNELVLDSYFKNHIYYQNQSDVELKAALCPEAELRSALFNQLFTGTEFVVSDSKVQPGTKKGFSQDGLLEGRTFYLGNYINNNQINNDYYNNVKITSVHDDLQIITSGTQFFSARAGNASEAWRLSWLKRTSKWRKEYSESQTVVKKVINWLGALFGASSSASASDENTKPNNMVRGSWGTYIGVEGYNQPMKFINIYIPGYDLNLMDEYFQIRYSDVSSYYPIMHRTELKRSPLFISAYIDSDKSEQQKYFQYDKFGGDTYVCTYTHRMQRNFEDPEVNINNEIIDENTFKDNYDPNNSESNAKINRSDVNAVQIGHWVTFKLLSNINLGFRDIDRSLPGEEALHGIPRGFFPLYGKSYNGNYKLPESQIINEGISSSNGEKYYFEKANVPYIKQEFDNTIIYSDVHINDAFKNGYRIFKLTSFNDYTREYGSITKLVNWFGSIICVFEHGIGLIPVNERVQSGEGDGGNVYINTNNVLPQNPRIINTNFGSQWIDSIISSENYVYGVDTVGKKIWRTDGETFEAISDFKIQKFLNDYITLDERELTPIIGIRNVKTHFNAFKKDIMFTFYDNTYGLEENVWNICWNELLGVWTTFYSWVPGESENIDNIYFSFDRNTMKWISKLGKSNINSTYSEGICIDNVIFDGSYPYPILKNNEQWVNVPPINTTWIGKLEITERNLPQIEGKTSVLVEYELLKDNFNSYQGFTLYPYYVTLNNPLINGESETKIGGAYLAYNKDIEKYQYYEPNDGSTDWEWRKRVYQLNIKANINTIIWDNNDLNVKQYSQGFKTYTILNGGFFTNSIAVAPILNISKFQKFIFTNTNTGISQEVYSDQTEYYDYLDNPDWELNEEDTKWYPGLTTDFWKHGQSGLLDIADDLYPTKWYGKVHPFEFEFVVTDNISIQKIFTNLYIISNKVKPESIHFEVVGENYSFADDKKNIYYRQELTKEFLQNRMSKDIMYDRTFRKIKKLVKQIKSYFFPLYYNRIDTFDEIYDIYQEITSSGKDYQNLTGTEIVWDKQLNEYRLVSHQKGMDIKEVGRLRGNMHYKEDIWNVEIKPFNFVVKNENPIKEENDPITWRNWIKKIPIIISQIPHLISPNNPGNTIIPSPYIPDNYADEEHIATNLKEANWGKMNETRIRDKYIKIKVRYNGEDLAVISSLKTIFTPSYA